jgi:fructose-1,6-bisphosphatase
MLVAHVGGCKPFGAGGTSVGAMATVTPGVTLHAVGVFVWGRSKDTETAPDPAAEDFTSDAVCGLQVLMHVNAKLENSAAQLTIRVGPLTPCRRMDRSVEGGLVPGNVRVVSFSRC